MTDDNTEIETSDTSLTIRRTFDATRERVWKAWTDPEALEQWYAPGDMTPAIHTVNPEPGGEFAVSYLGDETRTDVEGTFVEVVENERLLYTNRIPDELGPETRITVEFEEVDDGTEIILTQEKIPGEIVEEIAEGWLSTLNKLAEVL